MPDPTNDNWDSASTVAYLGLLRAMESAINTTREAYEKLSVDDRRLVKGADERLLEILGLDKEEGNQREVTSE